MKTKQQQNETFPLVNVTYHQKRIGMYKAKPVGSRSIMLRHGAISFPVGTALKIRFNQLVGRKIVCKSLTGIVQNNTCKGMLLTLPVGL
ncbi:MAG: hypothetical protein PVG12_10825 [Gammaproteobacteria bacterium]|jgi:hypothetical protein